MYAVIVADKSLVEHLSIEKRLFILNYALNDEQQQVVETCARKLLQSWLILRQNSALKLLKSLDVCGSSDLMTLMLDKLYANKRLDALIIDFVQLYLK